MSTRSTSIAAGLFVAAPFALGLVVATTTTAVAQCLHGECGPGMVCINCGRGPMCAEIPASCCAGTICGGGMVCIQTAIGPQCGFPPGGNRQGTGGRAIPGAPANPGARVTPPPVGGPAPVPFGAAWDETELGWSGSWTRRGGSDVFDARWVHPNGHRDAAELRISVSGRQVSILRRQAKGNCRYQGTLSADGRSMQGTYGCDWAVGPFAWRATVRDRAGGAPAARQPATGGSGGACPPGTVDLLGVCSGGVQRLR
mgnify:CR=1 FL=1